jgi:large repetitive protein
LPNASPARATTSTDVRTAAADLQVVSVLAPAAGFSGETAEVSWTVVNEGAAVWSGTRYWTDTVWLSRYPAEEGKLGQGAVEVGSLLHDNSAGFASGASYNASVEIRLPPGVEGPYYFYVTTDAKGARPVNGQASEHLAPGLLGASGGQGTIQNDSSRRVYATMVWEPPGLLNNLAATTSAIVYREADLVISNLSLESPSVESGSQLDVSFVVTNQGARQTRESLWFDRVYLSRDASLDVSDLLLGEFRRDGSLDSGASYEATLRLSLPEGIEGDYFVLAYTDSDVGGMPSDGGSADPALAFRVRVSSDAVKEYRGEGNNITATPLDVVLRPAPDLQVAAISIPERVLAGTVPRILLHRREPRWR